MAIDGQFGGRISFEFDLINYPPTEGDIEIDPSLVEVTGLANQDGSAAYHLKPTLVGAEFKLRHVNGVDWNALMFKIGNCTITEENNGRTHLFTKTRLTGLPKVNTATGEVSGLKIQGGQYTRLDT